MPYDVVSGAPQKVGAEHEGLQAAVGFMKPILEKVHQGRVYTRKHGC